MTDEGRIAIENNIFEVWEHLKEVEITFNESVVSESSSNVFKATIVPEQETIEVFPIGKADIVILNYNCQSIKIVGHVSLHCNLLILHNRYNSWNYFCCVQ